MLYIFTDRSCPCPLPPETHRTTPWPCNLKTKNLLGPRYSLQLCHYSFSPRSFTISAARHHLPEVHKKDGTNCSELLRKLLNWLLKTFYQTLKEITSPPKSKVQNLARTAYLSPRYHAHVQHILHLPQEYNLAKLLAIVATLFKSLIIDPFLYASKVLSM